MFLLEPDSNKEAMYIRHCAVSSIENGHKKVITDIHWLSDTFEVSLDGFTLVSGWVVNVKGFSPRRCFKWTVHLYLHQPGTPYHKAELLLPCQDPA